MTEQTAGGNGRARFASVTEVVTALRPDAPVHCLRPHVARRAAADFVAAFPGRAIYAVKCNPEPQLLRALADGGIHGFDVASMREIEQVQRLLPEARCYFMNPVKARSAIEAAYRDAGVRHFAVDHPTELGKILDVVGRDPAVTVVVRMTTSANGAAIHLADKFGASGAMAAEMLGEVAALGLRPGLGFHVGSQCTAADAYRAALANAAEVAETAAVAPQCLDVGGGFPVTYAGPPAPPLSAFVNAVNEGLAMLDLPADAEILAEPGRALVAEASTLITRIQLRKDGRLYINDGIYGSLSEAKLARIPLPARLIRPEGSVASDRGAFELAGATCDSLDILPDSVTLPVDAEEGDWIAIDTLGAYSTALATDFNGCKPTTFVEVADEPPARG